MAVMKDVAKLAGVSVSTVSFVLNGMAKEHKVADSTAQKVLHAAKQLGYKINSSVGEKNENKKWQPTVAFFVPMDAAWIDMSEIDAAIQRHMNQSERNYLVLFCLYEKGHLLEKMSQMNTDIFDSAVISLESEKDSEDIEQLDPDGWEVPFVLYNHLSNRHRSIVCVAEKAVTKAVKMIASKGYKTIRIFTGSESEKYGDEYLNLFIRICGEQGVLLGEESFLATENTMIGGAIAARSILNMEQKPELIVCMNISLAFGVIPLLARNHFLIPRDAELLCFGSSGNAEHIMNYIPSLSMIALPVDEITMKAFDLALRLAEEKEELSLHYKCSCELLLNDSFSL